MFNEDKAVKVAVNGVIVGCFRIVIGSRDKNRVRPVTIAVFVAKTVLWDDSVYDAIVSEASYVGHAVKRGQSVAPRLVLPRLQTTSLDRFSSLLLADL